MANPARLLHQLGAVVANVVDDLEDEGDRVYLGSTTHADDLRAAMALYDNYRFDTGDMGPEDALESVTAYWDMQRAVRRATTSNHGGE